MKALHVIEFILVIIGGLNWGLVGLGTLLGNNWNVVELIFGAGSIVTSVIYVLVGISALLLMFGHKKDCKTCA